MCEKPDSMDTRQRIVGITNSLRLASLNRMTLAQAAELAPAGMAIEIADIKSLPMYDLELEAQGLPAPVLALADTLHQADGVVLVSPEYNHSIPPAIKNCIDWLSRVKSDPWAGMPVMLVSATPGLLGGSRVQYELRRVLDAVGAVPMVRPEVFIGHADRKFDPEGRCTDELTRRMLTTQLQAFGRWIARHRTAGTPT